MPNNTIDSLQIEISASAEKANKAIDILQKQLDKICGAICTKFKECKKCYGKCDKRCRIFKSE